MKKLIVALIVGVFFLTSCQVSEKDIRGDTTYNDETFRTKQYSREDGDRHS